MLSCRVYVDLYYVADVCLRKNVLSYRAVCVALLTNLPSLLFYRGSTCI